MNKLKHVYKKQLDQETISFRIESETYRRWLAACASADISVSEGIRQLIKNYLEEMGV